MNFDIFLSDQTKPPFSLKLELMRTSKLSTASKNIKNIKSYIYIKKGKIKEKIEKFEILKIDEKMKKKKTKKKQVFIGFSIENHSLQ